MATNYALTSPQRTISDAFEQLKAKVKPEDVQKFQAATLHDVHSAAVLVEDKLATSKSLRNLRRIEPLLANLGRYAKVIEVLCNGIDYLPWIWAPIKLMLQLSQDYLSSLEKLVDAYSQICDALPRFDRFNSAFISDAKFQKVLAMFYADILEFHGEAYKFFTQKAWKRFFNTSWSGFQKRFKTILESLERHAELVDKEAVAADIAEAKQWREKQKSDLAIWEEERLESQKTSTRSWLDLGSDFNQDDELDERQERLAPGSCDWLRNHHKLQRWMAGSSSQRHLWLQGKPGAGKSVICAYLIQELQGRHDVIYFFCSHRSAKSRLQVFKHLVSQVLSIRPDLAAYVYEEFVSKAKPPSLRNLRHLLLDLLSSLASPRIVLDGVDELPLEDQDKVISEIITVVRDCSSSTGCSALFSSRDEPIISKNFTQKNTISLTNEEKFVNEAIEAFIVRELNCMKCLSSHLKSDPNFTLDDIKNRLVQRANGMFLWVHLVLASLKSAYSIKDLHETIDMLPSQLSDLYARILNAMRRRLLARNLSQADRIFEWIMFSQRPLKKSELLDGIALCQRNTTINWSTKLIPEVLDICKPLIEVAPNDTVGLVHFSLQEFLQSPESSFFLAPQTAHFDISLACVATMNRAMDILDETIPEESSIIHIGSGFLDLYPYAHRYWHEHLLCLVQILRTLNPPDMSTVQLVDLLVLFSEKHDRLLRRAQTEAILNPPLDDAISQESRLQFLDSSAHFFALIGQTVTFQRSLDAVGYQDGSELREFQLAHDPTLMSRLFYKFEHLVQHLLCAAAIPGLPDDILTAFKGIHGSTALKCRFSNCVTHYQGFPNEEERAEHEKAKHTPRFFCTSTDCPYRTLGFRSSSALNAHLRDYHDATRSLKIPGTVRQRLRKQQEVCLQPSESDMNLNVQTLTVQQQLDPGATVDEPLRQTLGVQAQENSQLQSTAQYKRPPTLTKEQFNTLAPHQQAAYRQLMIQAAQGRQHKQAEEIYKEGLKLKFTALMHIFRKSMEPRPQIQDLSQAVKDQMENEVQKAHLWIDKLDQIMFMDWVKHQDEGRAKGIIQVRHLLHAQLDPQTKKLKDNVTVNPATLHKLLTHISSYIKAVVSKNHNDKAQSQHAAASPNSPA